MQLTCPQLRTLRWYLEHRSSPPTFGSVLPRFARLFTMWLICTAFCVFLALRIDMPELAYFAVGTFFGAALREIRHSHFSMQVWPVIAFIVNWDRAEQLLADSESNIDGDSALNDMNL